MGLLQLDFFSISGDQNQYQSVSLYRNQVRSVPCLVNLSLTPLLLVVRPWRVKIHATSPCLQAELLHGFVKNDMGFSKLLHGFVKVVLCISRPLLKESKLKFYQDIKACWNFCFELKVLHESKYSTPWVRCGFGNVFGNWALLGNWA